MLLSIIFIVICVAQSESDDAEPAKQSNLHTETFEEKSEVKFENFAVQIVWSELNKESQSKLRATVKKFLRLTIPHLRYLKFQAQQRNSKTGGQDTRNNRHVKQSNSDKQLENTDKKETKSKKGLPGLYTNLKNHYGKDAKKTVSKIMATTTTVLGALVFPPLFSAGQSVKSRPFKEDLFGAKEVVVFLLYSSSEVSGTNTATPLSDAVVYDVSIRDADGELASLRYKKLPRIENKKVFIEDDTVHLMIDEEASGAGANLYVIVINKRLCGVLLTLYGESKKKGLKVVAQVTYQAQHGKQEEKTYKEDITEVESKSLDELMKHKVFG